jgi:alkylation response protein AidB-like acyl-CoA dehydrogenase
MATTRDDIGYYLETARALASRVAAASDRVEHGREIPPDLAGEIVDAGFFRLLVPRSLGGAELDFLDFLRIVRIFGEVDGSVAWCINQNNIFATNSVRISERAAEEIWGDRRTVVTNGPPISSARAVPVDGGYRLTGRWNFSSGVRHATWVAALTPISGADNDGNSATDPDSVRTLVIPKEDVTLVDNWQVGGLRGTGSLSFEVDDLFVPGYRSYAPSDAPREDGALYVIPTGLMFPAGFATVALGIARASLDAAIDLSGRKTPAWGRVTQREESTTQRQIGQAEAIFRSSRAFLRESTSSAWEGALKNHSLTVEERIGIRLAGTHAIRMAAEVVDIAYEVCGSNSIFASNPVQRRFQDIHVITQQAQGRMVHYDTVGQYFLGLEPEGMF